MALRDLFFQITATDNSGTAFQSVNRNLRSADGLATSLNERLGGLGRSMQRVGAIGSVASLGIAAAFRNVIGLYDEQARAEAKVTEAIRATGGAAGFTAEALFDQASAMQELTRFGDEEILNSVTAQLLTFKEIAGAVFLDAQNAALDLATHLDGDLQSSAIMLGKALNDPVEGLTALSRAGVTFSDEQANVIRELARTGEVAQAQRLILDEIASAYGDQAEAARQAGAGIQDAWSNTWGDIGEVVGKTVLEVKESVFPLLNSVAKAFQDMTPEGQKAVVMFGLMAVALPPLIAGLGLVVAGIAAVGAPIALAIAGIAGVSAAVALLWPETDKLTQSIDTLVGSLETEVGQFSANSDALAIEAAASATTTAQKYLEARSRYENARAAVAEYRATILTGQSYRDLRAEIEAESDIRPDYGIGTGAMEAAFDGGGIRRRNTERMDYLLGLHGEMLDDVNALERRNAETGAALDRLAGGQTRAPTVTADLPSVIGTTAGNVNAAPSGFMLGTDTGGAFGIDPSQTGALGEFADATGDVQSGAEGAASAIGGGGGLADAVGEAAGVFDDAEESVTAFSQSPGWQNAKDNMKALIFEGQSFGDTWRGIFADATDRIFDLAFSPAWDALWQNLEKSFNFGGGGVGAGGGGFGGLMTGLTGFVGSILGLDTGGSFQVSGKAGVDRNLTVLRTSDSETVDVRRNGDNGGGNVNVYIQTPSPQAFQASRAQIGGQIGRAVAAGQRAA